MLNDNINVLINPPKVDVLEQLKSRKIWAGYIPSIKSPMFSEGKHAKSDDISTWQTYDGVVSRFGNNVGIFCDGTTLLIDLDHITKDGTATDGIIDDPVAKKFLDECDTYTEWSPSKTGAHAIYFVTEPIELETHSYNVDKNISRKYEFWGHDNRFFTITENRINSLPIKTIDSEEAFKLLEMLGYGTEIKDLQPYHTPKKSDGNAPWDWFNNNIKIDEILEPHGWTKLHIDKVGKETWKRPGKKENTGSATFNFDGNQMFRVFSSSVPGFDNEKSYTKFGVYALLNCGGDVKKAVKEIKEKYSESGGDIMKFTPAKLDKNGFTTKINKEGNVSIPATPRNIKHLLKTSKEFSGKFRFDIFRQRKEIFVDNEWRQLKDPDYLSILNRVSEIHFAFVGAIRQKVIEAVESYCYENSYDSVVDYFKAGKWDGISRLDTWVAKAFNVEDNLYHSEIGKYWLMGMVKRVTSTKEIKFDNVLVLQGSQGIRKSEAFSVLAKDWYLETTETPNNKDFFVMLQGKMIVEFSEGETLSRSESKKLKAVITTKVDEFRRAYGREHEVLPRRTSFTMTTNEEEYLKDVTGNRRWWIIKIPFGQVVDIEWLKTNVDQLLFEAYHEAVVLKKPYWNLSKEVISTLETKHADSMEGYAWEKPIVRWYLNLSKDEQRDGVDHEMAYEAICNRNSDGEQILKMIDQKEKNQIGKIFRGVLKLKKDRKMVDGISEELYFPTDDTPKKENTGNFSKTYIKHSFDVNMFA
jgi:hypothetical protein